MRPTLVMVTLLAATLAPLAGAEEGLDVHVVLDGATAQVNIVQTWTGEDATSFRRALDRIFGDADGDLSRDEVDAIEEATEKTIVDKAFPLVGTQAGPATVDEVDVSFDGARGAVEQDGDVSTTHELVLDLGGNETTELRFVPLKDARITVTAPAGRVFAGPDGLGQVTLDAGNLTGNLLAGLNATVRLEEPVAPQADPVANGTATNGTSIANGTTTTPDVGTPPANATSRTNETSGQANGTRPAAPPADDATSRVPPEEAAGPAETPGAGVAAFLVAVVVASGVARLRGHKR